ncbi:pyruvate:ferredoxin (flavodoxin) oxidoreductase [Candidatus Woesearchaeota archaeon]|nr:pyruvate:ferredoxin (flavodoxin) oxidoreductase [Candidatus Woesearchaeota archaeon]
MGFEAARLKAVHIEPYKKEEKKEGKKASRKDKSTTEISYKKQYAKQYATIDGNAAAAHVAYAFSEAAAIYPITPSSPMAELADEWSTKGKTNMFGNKLVITEMQSETGAAGTIHGLLSGGTLATTFTSSQGLLLMIPNMFKIAGELLPTVFHVAARSLAYQSLSIFGDHSDVMSVRSAGFAMLSASSVQEVMDTAIIAHLATLESRVPFVHFFDGFRTSHEIQKIELVDYEAMRSMLDIKYVHAFRSLALNPARPMIKVAAQNPDVYFQGREASNIFYESVPNIVKKYMAALEKKTGRKYSLFDYVGDPNAECIITAIGSGAETVEETVKYLNKQKKKVGLVKVRLFRPFSVQDFSRAVPKSVKRIAVLDRTKESGSIGEPLYMDVVAALKERGDIRIIGGRYGLSSKEFTPAMVVAVFDHLLGKCTHDFTVGINDDVTHKSLQVGEEIDIEPQSVTRCKFWGFGSDGTVGANKNAIKIIGEHSNLFAQAYFSYDSRKSGGVTISDLRFGKEKIASPYLLTKADFIAVHKAAYIGKYNLLEGIKEGGIFLLNAPWPKEKVFGNLTKEMQDIIIGKNLKFYAIDADRIADEVGLHGKASTVMQVAFFKLAGPIPEEKAIDVIMTQIKKYFKEKGEEVVKMNLAAVERALEGLYEAPRLPINASSGAPESRSAFKSEFENSLVEPALYLRGDSIPVSAMPVDGMIRSGTTKFEKRRISNQVSSWIPETCIQCGLCAIVCPHASIRMKQIYPADLAKAPKTFKTLKSNTPNKSNLQFKVQVYPEDCTGCDLCVVACPTKAKSLKMSPIAEEIKKGEIENAAFFESLPDNVLEGANIATVKGCQLRVPLFEFSGACSGCGETPYVKLLTQLFGENLIVANATGCSSIYGGTFPTIPYTTTKEGRGPAWGNSLFEDNAEYGFGLRLAVDLKRELVIGYMNQLLKIGTDQQLQYPQQYQQLQSLLKSAVDSWKDPDKLADLSRQIIALLPDVMKKSSGNAGYLLENLNLLRDFITDKSVWMIGGDGWAYDIGFGGLDHVLAKGKRVKMLVLDTEVYSNTGGQASKSTPLGVVAKFATSGKEFAKKNLGLMMMSYGYVYVASVNLGADKNQVVRAMIEAEKYDGPALILAYAPCIAHGYDLRRALDMAKNAVDSGYWHLYRFNPALAKQGQNPFVWESPEPKTSFKEYIMGQNRYSALKAEFPEKADALLNLAEESAKKGFESMKKLSQIDGKMS